MSWSYQGDPSASDLDAVRYLTGETDETSQTTQDEEINWQLTQEGGVYAAAAAVADALAGRFASKVDVRFGPSGVSNSQKATNYKKLATDLRRRIGMRVAPYAGGISIADKTAREQEADRVLPAFKRGTLSSPPENILSDFD